MRAGIRRFWILLSCLAIGIGGVLVFASLDHQPKHQGRALSRWVMTFYESDRPGRDREQSKAAANAIGVIGTNAVPLLLKWTRYETPPWHRALVRNLPRPIAYRVGESGMGRATLYRGFHRAEAARVAFHLLGTQAVAALPELQTMMGDRTHPETAGRAMGVLAHLGPSGFQVLRAGLANTNQPFRLNIALRILLAARELGADTCLPPLVAARDNDPDPAIRLAVSNMVMRIQMEK